MTEVDKTFDAVNNFIFTKGGYLDAKEKFLKFADSYEKISPEDADLLRSLFDSKIRLGWFQTSVSVFKKYFPDADELGKGRLYKIFFALYSFQNLDFGYDGLTSVDSISEELARHRNIAKKNWDIFCKLTSSDLARSNMESKLFFK